LFISDLLTVKTVLFVDISC